MFPLRYHPQICGGLDVDSFLKALQAEGIPVSRAYEKTMFQQPALQDLAAKRPEYLRRQETPVADEIVKHLIYIPHHVFLSSESEVDEVAAAFRKVEAHYSRRTSESFAQNRIAQPDGQHSPVPSQVSASAKRPSTQLRVGIIGAGFMGMQHGNVLSKLPDFAVTAISDVDPKAARRAADLFRCAAYDSAERLIQDGQADVIVIATPHWQHADIAMLAFAHKRHVICEKPLTVTVEQADRLVEAAARSGKLFAVVHQTRFEPSYQFAKKLLDGGELGALYRCIMVESAWRTAAYYCSSSWRGTWKGEGGGVLLNQAPHVLDRYAWLCGMPETVLGRCDTNLHSIEVEDTVSAVFRHATGAHGILHVNTVEAPAISSTMLCCDRGKILLDRGQVTVTRLKESIKTATRTDARAWGDLPTETSTLEFGWSDINSLLVAFYDNFAKAAQGNATLICPGDEGRYAVELANAILLSSYEGRKLELPLSRSAYSSFIDSRIHSSNGSDE
jgi:predicted dehydrogenase